MRVTSWKELVSQSEAELIEHELEFKRAVEFVGGECTLEIHDEWTVKLPKDVYTALVVSHATPLAESAEKIWPGQATHAHVQALKMILCHAGKSVI